MARADLPRCAQTLNPELDRAALDALLDQIRRNLPPSPWLKTGAAAGGALRDMLLCFDHEQAPQITVIDPLNAFPAQKATILRNLNRHGVDEQKIMFRLETSRRALPRALRARDDYGLILLDSATGLTDMMHDLTWARLLKLRGLLCVNHVDDQHPGAQRALFRFRAANPEYELVAQAGAMQILRKKSVPAKPEVTVGERVYAALTSMVYGF